MKYNVIVALRYILIHFGPFSFIRVKFDTFGYILVNVDTFWYIWIHFGTSGYILDTFRYNLIHLDTFWYISKWDIWWWFSNTVILNYTIQVQWLDLLLYSLHSELVGSVWKNEDSSGWPRSNTAAVKQSALAVKWPLVGDLLS